MCCGGTSDAAPGGAAMPEPRERGLIDMLWDPQDRSERMAGLGLAAGLLEASAPSTDPRHGSLGYVLGQGIDGAMQGMRQGARPGAAMGSGSPADGIDIVPVETQEAYDALPPGTVVSWRGGDPFVKR
jgi:hypothetical protein